MSNLLGISTYQLLFELLHDGNGGLHKELEPIDINCIFEELEYRHGKREREANTWVEWFISANGTGSKKEKDSLKMTQRILNLEKYYTTKIGHNDSGKG